MKPADLRTLLASLGKPPFRFDSDEYTAWIAESDGREVASCWSDRSPAIRAIIALANHGPALLELVDAVTAYIESDDEDRVLEHDAMVAALARLEDVQ